MAAARIRERLCGALPLAFSLHQIIFDASGLPVDYRLVQANKAFETMLGLKGSQAIGKNMSEWLQCPGAIRGKWFSAFSELASTGTVKEFEDVLELNDLSLTVTAFVPYPGHLIVLLYDAVRSRQSKASFQHTLASLRSSLETGCYPLCQSLFHNSPSAIMIYEVRGNGASSMDYVIRGANPASLEMHGWRENEVLGRPLGEVRPGVEGFGIIDTFQQVWETGKAARCPVKAYREGQEHRWFENTVFKLPTGEIVAISDDVTARRQAEEALHAEKERLKVILSSLGDAVITTDSMGRIEILNQVAERLVGWSQDEARGRPLTEAFELYDESARRACDTLTEMVFRCGHTVNLTKRITLACNDGRKLAVTVDAAPIRDQDRGIEGVVLVIRDVTKANSAERKIKYLGRRDSLTGLYNRAFFERELKRLDTYSEDRYPLTLIMGDLDGLKFINDVFGHQIGDQALVKVSQAIKASCRASDMIARWGGDEMVILLPETPEDLAQKICYIIKERCLGTKVADTTLSISLGYASKIDGNETWEEVLKKAEDNMYKSKLLGSKSHRNIILSSIKSTLFEKSCETQEHGERLGVYCREIGRIMGLGSYEIDELEVLAMLHDMGKIAIDERILKKSGLLTNAETQALQRHPEIGYRIARTVPELLNIADYILAHHERWDGKGYPRGLAGEDIPLQSRILAVVDAYDAITQGRPYRKARSSAKARDELRAGAGSQFDPQVVDIFISCLERQESGQAASDSGDA